MDTKDTISSYAGTELRIDKVSLHKSPQNKSPFLVYDLSELKLFKGDITDFQYSDNVYEYSMSTPLFTDYAHKLRVVAIPDGEQLTYKGGGLLDFPNNLT